MTLDKAININNVRSSVLSVPLSDFFYANRYNIAIMNRSCLWYL